MGDPGIPSVEHQIETYVICKRIVEAVIADEEIPLPADIWQIRKHLYVEKRGLTVHVELPYQPERVLDVFIFRLAHQIERMRPVIEAAQRLEAIANTRANHVDDEVEAAITGVIVACETMRGDR